MKRAILLILAIGLGACGERIKPEPVAECQAYEAALTACFHRPSQFSRQASLLPETRSQRKRIAQLCSDNLKRLRTACR
jgi:hypothetical protein